MLFRSLAAAADRLRRVHLELGGKSAHILLDGDDLDMRVPVLSSPSFGMSEDPRDSPEYIPNPDRHRRIPWKVIGIVTLALVVAVIGLRYFGDYMNSEPLALAVTDKDGQLQIQWNPQSSTVTRASSASRSGSARCRPSTTATAASTPRAPTRTGASRTPEAADRCPNTGRPQSSHGP